MPVHGGDINDSFRISTTNGQQYFLKENNLQSFPGMFAREAEGLTALRENSILQVPAVIACGNDDEQQWLLMEWLEPGSPTKVYWENFGHALALQHQQSNKQFGWKNDNYIGSLPQVNDWQNKWQAFYTNNRIMPLSEQLRQQGKFSSKDIAAAENFCNRLPELMPEEPPALLHGDLWSGNCMCTINGSAAIYDPAVYYGHREMDLGMTQLFGGFATAFYLAYDNAYPLDAGWQERLPVTQLYPVLVHAVLFGSHYVQQAANILKQYG